MKTVTDTTFIKSVFESTKPVLVKFEAKWCRPCKAMTPVILELEKMFSGVVSFYSANVDHCMMAAQRCKIKQIPALVLIENGTVTAMRTGASSKGELIEWIKSHLTT